MEMTPQTPVKKLEVSAPVVEQPVSKVNPKAITAWYDADTDEKKAAAVKAFPELATIFSQAHTIINKK